MTMPSGFSAVAFSDAGGIPQTATLGAGVAAPLRLSLVAVASDLAALLSADPDRILHTAAAARRPAARGDLPPDTWRAADEAARAALLADPGTTLDAAQLLVVLIVHENRRVVTVWPPLPGRPLPVRDASGLRGELWVDELAVSAGSLVAAGATGARFSVGWRGGVPPESTPARRERGPYDSLA